MQLHAGIVNIIFYFAALHSVKFDALNFKSAICCFFSRIFIEEQTRLDAF
jgi:hypothetical protein